jgi:hypothetical protein
MNAANGSPFDRPPVSIAVVPLHKINHQGNMR